MAIIFSVGLVIIALQLVIFHGSSKSSYLFARKETVPTSQCIFINSLEENETRSTAIFTNSKPFFHHVVKWAGDELMQNDPTYRIPRIQQVFIANHEYIIIIIIIITRAQLKEPLSTRVKISSK